MRWPRWCPPRRCAPALVWAAFAVALPLVARGRWAAVDLLLGAVWAVGLVMAHDWLGELMSTGSGLQTARGAVAGAALGALVAVTAILLGGGNGISPTCPRNRHYPDEPPMSVLKNLEAKLGGLVEGAFSRAFKSRVEPVELARKLAREMEESKQVSVSRVYVPNHYRVFLSPQDREQFESYEPALRKELSDYLLEHARAERLALTSRPAVEFMTDERLGLGEFGIQAQLLGETEPEPGQAEAEAAPSQGDFGHTMVYSPDRAARKLEPEPVAPVAGGAGGRRAPDGAQRRARGDRPQPRL